jgi:prepilin-type N-terminal cleavage/methylation domain-containing protein
MIIRREFHVQEQESDSGFTLVELLAVIAIIGLLAALLFPAISGIQRRSRIAFVKAQLQQIEHALNLYYEEFDTFPPMGNDWLGGMYFASEDIGKDLEGPFVWNNATDEWEENASYTGPDDDGTEMNYELDTGEDLGLDNAFQDPYDDNSGIPNAFSDNDGILAEISIGENNGRLDGTYYDSLGMLPRRLPPNDETRQPLIDIGNLWDIFLTGDSPYHYYAGHVTGRTSFGMPKFREYSDLTDYLDRAPNYYNRWVIYSVGLDGRDHGLHNYYLVMQDGEDVGQDAFASDVSDDDNDDILFEPSTGENDGNNTVYVVVTIQETDWTTPGVGDEQASPGGNPSLEGPTGEPVFSYDVREQRRREGNVYAMPDGDPVAFGVIMRYGP